MKTKRTLLISCMLMMATSFLVSAVAQDIDAGKKLIETNQWNRANKFFIDQVKSNLQNQNLKFYLGETYLALDKTDSAQSNFNSGIEDPFCLAGTGKIILIKGDTTKAKEIFNKALKKDKKNGDLYAYIVDACVSSNYVKLAEQFYARGKEVTTKDALLYIAAGNLAKLKGNAGEAANAYENAYYYDKKLTLAYVKVGMIYTDSRSWDVAAKNFNDALAIDPQYSLAFKGLGDMYYKEQHYQEASDNYKKYFENSEVTLDDNYRYAIILFFNKQYAEATKMINSLLVTDAKNPVLLRLQAYISYELGVDEKGKVNNPESIQAALTNITKFFKIQDPKKLLESDYEYLAKIQVASKLDSLAPDNYMKAFDMDSTKMNLLEEGAKINSKLGLYLKAVPFYQRLIRMSPENAAINSFKMGQQYYFEANKDTAKSDSLVKRSNLVLADSAFKTVANLIPTNQLGPLWMARTESILDQVKQEGLANPEYEKVIQIIESANDQVKKKKDLLEAYNYFASLYYLKAYNALIKNNLTEMNELKAKSLDFWNKIKVLSPEDPRPDEGIKAVNEIKKAQPKKPQQ